MQGFSSNEDVKEGYPLKRRHFAVIGSNNVKTVADRYIHAALVTGFLDLSTSMTLNDLKPLKKRFLVNLSQFLNAAHISTLNCDEMAGVRPRQFAYEICSIKRRFQQSKSRSPRFMEPGAPLLKSGYFTAIICCCVKTIANTYRHAVYY